MTGVETEPVRSAAGAATGERERRVSAFRALSAAMAKGFFRDRASVFFSLVFPLMFLFLFGGVFADQGQSRSDLVQIGAVPLVDQMPAEARKAFDQAFDVTRTSHRAAALEKVRKGDADAAIEMSGTTLVAHYTQTDQVKAAITQGTLKAFVDAANASAAGSAPTFAFRAEPVEDASLKTIQFVTPGLLGWAVAMSAAFGAAATLQGWRQSKLLRRLQLSPVPTRSIVGARIGVTIGIALVQMAIFVGLGSSLLGLRLDGAWWMAVPLLICGTLSFMSIGLLAGSVSRTTEGAVNMANFIVLPMAFLSGSFFPLDGAPGWLQVVSRALPLRHLNDGMLDVMVRGQSWTAAFVPMGILLGFTLVLTAIAARLFRWETA
jgi:ABC-2 type transport system permease protein